MLSIFSRYNDFVLRRPILANSLTTGFLLGTGDYLAQTFFTDEHAKYDYSRTLRAVIYGSIIFAPLGDKWYKFLAKVKTPFIGNRAKYSSTKLGVYDTVSRVAYDQLIFAPFIGIPLYYSVMSMLELRENALEYAQAKLQKNWASTLVTNWMIWPIFQLINFYFIPVQMRLLCVNTFSIGWNCFLSYELNKEKHEAEIK